MAFCYAPAMPKLRLLLLLTGALAASHAVAAQSTGAVTGPAKPRPLYYRREITSDDLKGRSLRERSLMRNTIYARAGNKFRKKWLNDYFSAQPWYHPLDKMDEKKLTAIDRRNAELIAMYDAFLTRDQLLAMQKAVGTPKTPEDRIELRLLSMRLGKWLGPPDPERTPLEDPALLDQQITVDQLSDFSRRDLRLVRNLIYARHGRPFRSELLQKYFSTVNWYKSDPQYTDARLTAIDKRNIKVIRSLEDELGGPLTDLQHKLEDGWFANA
jgi:hypothetical protein